MGEADFRNVLQHLRLADGTVFPIPVTLLVQIGDEHQVGTQVVLRDAKNVPLAIMEIEEDLSVGRGGVCRPSLQQI
jgi:sulfate adenylyltransferase